MEIGESELREGARLAEGAGVRERQLRVPGRTHCGRIFLLAAREIASLDSVVSAAESAAHDPLLQAAAAGTCARSLRASARHPGLRVLRCALHGNALRSRLAEASGWGRDQPPGVPASRHLESLGSSLPPPVPGPQPPPPFFPPPLILRLFLFFRDAFWGSRC